MIYISSPYTHKDVNITHRRMYYVEKFVLQLMVEGKSPVSVPMHFHHLIERGVLSTDGEFWDRYYRPILVRSRVVYVLMLEGWEESSGVGKEIQLALDCGIEVVYYKINEVDDSIVVS